ncbi:hypothetical protein [Limnoraphis robusta]|uniref:hypothetical protein n=1 Tax=Limnoraphis robusta TaxID=1118279 RepID=UPI002B1F57C7|nr:hypothetical protein [Limnoraphis robusta]MEA5547198.1 hypothetical protein [Limnoraphis robusta CCNP1324]
MGDVIVSDKSLTKLAIATPNLFSNLNSVFSRVSLIPNLVDTLYITSLHDVIVSDHNLTKLAIATPNLFSNLNLVFSRVSLIPNLGDTLYMVLLKL